LTGDERIHFGGIVGDPDAVTSRQGDNRDAVEFPQVLDSLADFALGKVKKSGQSGDGSCIVPMAGDGEAEGF
jgi:hypothetical protein